MKTNYTTSYFTSYKVTGKDRSGKRFSMTYSNYSMAKCINVWTGTLFGILPTGKKVVLQRY